MSDVEDDGTPYVRHENGSGHFETGYCGTCHREIEKRRRAAVSPEERLSEDLTRGFMRSISDRGQARDFFDQLAEELLKLRASRDDHVRLLTDRSRIVSCASELHERLAEFVETLLPREDDDGV